MILASFIFSFMGLSMKYALVRIPTPQAVFFRSSVALVLLVLWRLVRGKGMRNLLGERRRLLFLRGLFGSIGLLLFVTTIKYLQLGESIVLIQLSPVFVLVFAWVFLKERMAPSQIGLVLLALGGVVMVVQPGFRGFSPASLIGVVAAAFAGGAYTLVRGLTVTEDNETILLYLLLVSVAITAPYLLYDFVLPTPLELLSLVGAGASAFAAQLVMNQAYRVEKAGAVAAAGSSGVFFSALWGYLFWGEVPCVGKAVGASVILAAVVGLALTRSHRPVLHTPRPVSSSG